MELPRVALDVPSVILSGCTAMQERDQDRQPLIPLDIYLRLRPWFATLVILIYAITTSHDVRTLAIWFAIVVAVGLVMGCSWACIAERAGRFNGGQSCRICVLASSLIVFAAFAIVAIAIRTKF